MFKWLNAPPSSKSAAGAKPVLQPKTDQHNRTFAYALDLGGALFAEHGLSEWRLTLDHARRRAGQCDYRNKTISLSRHYVRYADNEHIKDTLLHEIAHALVGPKHGHDAVWRQKAREIGCTATRCHTLDFSVARWQMLCPNGCFETTRHRRKPNMICATCKAPIIYKSNGAGDDEASDV